VETEATAIPVYKQREGNLTHTHSHSHTHTHTHTLQKLLEISLEAEIPEHMKEINVYYGNLIFTTGEGITPKKEKVMEVFSKRRNGSKEPCSKW
jgi:hypothetical protein